MTTPTRLALIGALALAAVPALAATILSTFTTNTDRALSSSKQQRFQFSLAPDSLYSVGIFAPNFDFSPNYLVNADRANANLAIDDSGSINHGSLRSTFLGLLPTIFGGVGLTGTPSAAPFSGLDLIADPNSTLITITVGGSCFVQIALDYCYIDQGFPTPYPDYDTRKPALRSFAFDVGVTRYDRLGNRYDVALTPIPAVPQPAALALFGVGILSFALRRTGQRKL